jgi:flagellar basal-body rod modification protein FlgD
MIITPITNAAGGSKSVADLTTPTPTSSVGTSSLGVNDFLKLITVQLQNQDPLKPMDDTQFISQMASFTNLQQTQTLTADFESFSQQAAMNTAKSFLGGYVTVSDSTLGTVSGQVNAIKVENGIPKLVINGISYDLGAVQSVSSTPPATVPVTSGSTPQS